MVDVTQTMACIQCGACVSDCLSMEVDPEFIGPAALAKAYRFVGDPRDGQQFERLKDLSEDPHGIYDCTHCFNCIEACPKGVAPMSQIMRLRRIAGADHHIDDRNNGHRHEQAFVTLVRSGGLLHEAELLPRSYGGDSWFGKFHPKRGRGAARTRCRSIAKALQRRKVTPKAALEPHKMPRPTTRPCKRIFDTIEDRDERATSSTSTSSQPDDEEQPAGDGAERRRRGRRATCPPRGARTREGRVLARLREPRLHPGAARLDGEGRAAARHRARRARPRSLLRRRRHRRAQPGARRHAQRAHVRARPAGRRRGPDDEHLLDLPGRAERVPAAPGRERGVPRARQRDARARGPRTTRRASPTSTSSG